MAGAVCGYSGNVLLSICLAYESNRCPIFTPVSLLPTNEVVKRNLMNVSFLIIVALCS